MKTAQQLVDQLIDEVDPQTPEGWKAHDEVKLNLDASKIARIEWSSRQLDIAIDTQDWERVKQVKADLEKLTAAQHELWGW